MTAETQTLPAWLLDQIADDEAKARAASAGPWGFGGIGVGTCYWDGREEECIATTNFTPSDTRDPRWEGFGYMAELKRAAANGDHIARHDPARVLAECEAKRRIVARHAVEVRKVHLWPTPDDPRDHEPEVLCEVCGWIGDDPATAGCPDVKALALPLADRPGYRPEWRP